MRYLDQLATAAAMPSFDEQMRLAEESLVGVEDDGQVPGKVGVHPRPTASIAYAMPAVGPERERVGRPPMGVKWVTVFPANSRVGLPTVGSLVILNDPVTLQPTDIMNGSATTPARTAAISGVVIRLYGQILGPTPVVALVGAGVQGWSHLAM
jgi:ornithine cyclodeaminase/alanine dehydrogenase-like protein (mu-crystallin family)